MNSNFNLKIKFKFRDPINCSIVLLISSWPKLTDGYLK